MISFRVPTGNGFLTHVMNQLYVIAMPVVGGNRRPSMSRHRPFRQTADGHWRRLFAWADGGKTITWAVGASLFREPLSAISFEPPKDEKKEGEQKDDDKKTTDAKDLDQEGRGQERCRFANG